MKYLTTCLLVLGILANAQNIVKHAPDGFNVLETGIPNGKIDSVSYPSKTVGVSRKVMFYTPPGYSKKTKYPMLYLLHGIGGDEKESLKGGSPQVILGNLYKEKKIEPMIAVMPNGRAMENDRATGNIFDVFSSTIRAAVILKRDSLC